MLSIFLASVYSLLGQSPKEYFQEFVGPDEKLLSADHQNIYVKTASGQYVQKSIKVQEVFPYLVECEQEDPELQKACSQQKFLEAIYREIKYPKKARELGIQGEAVFRFVIEKDGALAQAVAMRGVCAEIEAECLRVIELLPAWNPGQQNGRAVRVQFNLPIRFRLE